MILRTVHINFVNTDREWGFRECEDSAPSAKLLVKREV